MPVGLTFRQDSWGRALRGEATGSAYGTDEAKEGRDAFVESETELLEVPGLMIT